MLVNKISSIDFRAVKPLVRTMSKHSEEQLEIENTIVKRLNKPYPSSSKNISYADYFEKEKGLDIIITNNDCPKSPVTVIAQKKHKNNSRRIFDDSFVVGNYYGTRFRPEDVIEAQKEHQSDKKVGAFAVIATLVGLGVLLLGNVKASKNLFKDIPQKAIELNEKIPETLKILK